MKRCRDRQSHYTTEYRIYWYVYHWIAELEKWADKDGTKWKDTFEKTFKHFVLVYVSFFVFSISATFLDAFSICLRYVIHYSVRKTIYRRN